MTHVLLVEPDPAGRGLLRQLLDKGGFDVREVPAEDLDKPLDLGNAQCIVAAQTPRSDGIALLEIAGSLPVVLVARDGSIAEAVAAIKQGASDYLTYPFATEKLTEAVQRAAASAHLDDTSAGFPMIGQSPTMGELFEMIAKIAPTDSSVLIRGESGTGKELVAHALHAASKRRHAQMITLNCAAIPQDLMETELFGRSEPGSAPASDPNGLLEAAHGGTLFLDEIGELPAETQGRLLRVLREGEIRRVGSAEPMCIDVRLIAATHSDLQQLIDIKQFRDDLYYRLNVVSLDIAPLRERGDDVHLLADSILERATRKLSKNPMSFSTDARRAMSAYQWPGNVWELENAVERAVILCDGNEIGASLLAIDVKPPSAPGGQSASSDQTSLEDYFVTFVTAHQEALTETELAAKLGISRKSLWERRQRLNIPRKKTRKRGPRRHSS